MRGDTVQRVSSLWTECILNGRTAHANDQIGAGGVAIHYLKNTGFIRFPYARQ